MSVDFPHSHSQFPDLIRIVAQQKGIDPALVGKDYWIMHRLLGLQKVGYEIRAETLDVTLEGPSDHQPLFGRHRYSHRAAARPRRGKRDGIKPSRRR